MLLEQEDLFTLTKNAIQAIHRQFEKDDKLQYLRVGCKGGGCSGYSTFFQFEETKKSTDIVFNVDGATVIIDPKSMKLLQGSTLDFHRSLLKSGFKLDIPSIKTCGCGNSFNKV